MAAQRSPHAVLVGPSPSLLTCWHARGQNILLVCTDGRLCGDVCRWSLYIQMTWLQPLISAICGQGGVPRRGHGAAARDADHSQHGQQRGVPPGRVCYCRHRPLLISFLTVCLRRIKHEGTSVGRCAKAEVFCKVSKKGGHGSDRCFRQDELANLRAPSVQACLVTPLPQWREPWTRGPLDTTQNASVS